MSLTPLHIYAGVPISTRGEVTHISSDPSGATDAIAFPAGRVAVVRSTTDALSCSVFTGHASPVTAVRFAPDGARIASGDEAGNVRVWDRETHKAVMDETVTAGPVRDIAFAADGKFVVIAGEARGAYAKAVKVPSGGSAGVCMGHTKRAVACDVAGKVIVTGSEDMSVGLYKGPPVREMDTPRFLKGHSNFVNDVRFSPDGKLVAIASSVMLTIADVESGETLRTFMGHTGSVTGIAWAPDGETVYTSANDKTNKAWCVSDGKCLSTVTHGSNLLDMQVGCAFVAKTKALVSASLRGEVSVMEGGATSPTRVLRGHAKQIVGLAVVGPKAYSADYSGLLVHWDVGVGSNDNTFSGKGPATSVCGIAANDSVVANVGQDGKIFVTSTANLEYPKPVTVKGGGVDIAVPSSSSAAASCVMVNETRLVALSPAGDSVLAELVFPRGETGVSVAVNSDASLIAVGVCLPGDAGEVRFAKVSGHSLAFVDGKVVRMNCPANKLAFSPDGSVVAVGEASRRVKFYDTDTCNTVEGGGIAHTSRVDAIVFDPSGTHVATGAMDGSVAVWKVNSDDDPLREKSAHRGGVTGIGFSDASTLVTSGCDSCIRSWTI